MSKEYAFKDATSPLTLHVTQADINGATPGSSRNCVLSRAARREHNCFDVTVFRTVAYVRKRENSVPLRYQISESVKDVLVAFDAAGRAHPITVTFMPPRGGISLKRLRSARQKAVRKKSHARARERAQSGGQRRAYTRPSPLTLLGVRNGSGGRPPGRGRLPTSI